MARQTVLSRKNRGPAPTGKGTLIGVDAASGRITTQKELGSPIYVAPIVAQGQMYVLTDNAKLIVDTRNACDSVPGPKKNVVKA